MRSFATHSKAFLVTALLALVVLFVPAGAAEFEKNIMTGGPQGTYIRIGRDMAKLGAQCGQTLNVIESAGSLENFAGVRNRRNTQFGIVQSDVLEYLKTYEANDAEIQKAVRGVRIMFPLYNEEVHLLATRDIASPRDLEGRKVAIGTTDSGTYLTASLVLDILRVKDAERLATGAAGALEQLLKGEIDAFFYVAGAPAGLFDDARIDPEKFHLVPMTEAPLKATYTPTRLAAGTYPFVSGDIDMVAVKAVLMTFDYDKARNAYHRQSCKAVADFASLLLSNLDRLRQEGHPKWQSVDLTEVPPGWQVGVCVKEGMALDYKVDCAAAAPAGDSGDDEYLDLLKKRLNSGQ
ncbi:MAG: TAXI family TRAP transporter solute-binding subunit [Pseudomonadota bacterium]|nr:TAXI family TRAP transporter solute-binding subunit [Pseudomonadota bacterium]